MILPVSTYLVFSSGATVASKFWQTGHLKSSTTTTSTGALSCPAKGTPFRSKAAVPAAGLPCTANTARPMRTAAISVPITRNMRLGLLLAVMVGGSVEHLP